MQKLSTLYCKVLSFAYLCSRKHPPFPQKHLQHEGEKGQKEQKYEH